MGKQTQDSLSAMCQALGHMPYMHYLIYNLQHPNPKVGGVVSIL